MVRRRVGRGARYVSNWIFLGCAWGMDKAVAFRVYPTCDAALLLIRYLYYCQLVESLPITVKLEIWKIPQSCSELYTATLRTSFLVYASFTGGRVFMSCQFRSILLVVLWTKTLWDIPSLGFDQFRAFVV